MHPVITMKSWSHHLHDSMLLAWHEVDQHVHSRHFWAGVALTLLIVGFVALLVLMAKNVPVEPLNLYPYGIPLGPYGL